MSFNEIFTKDWEKVLRYANTSRKIEVIDCLMEIKMFMKRKYFYIRVCMGVGYVRRNIVESSKNKVFKYCMCSKT